MIRNIKNMVFAAILVVLMISLYRVSNTRADVTANSSRQVFAPPPAITELMPDSFRVSWPEYAGFNKTTHYQVQLNHTFYGSSLRETSQTIRELTPGGKYNVSVVTFQDGAAAGVSSSTPVLMRPDFPQHIRVYDIASASFKVFWQQVAGATAYRIYRYPTIILAEPDSSAVRAHITGLEPGSFLSVMMTTLNESGESYHSEPIPVHLLPAPPPLSIVEGEVGQTWFKVQWEPTGFAQTYHLFVNDEEVASLSADITDYTIEGLPAGTTVNIQISVANTTGTSELSEPLMIQLIPANPVLGVSQVSSFSCTLNWSVANGASYYKIYQDNDWAIFNVPSTINTVTVTEVVPGQVATFSVVAGNSAGLSDHSNRVQVTFTDRAVQVFGSANLNDINGDSTEIPQRLSQRLRGQPIVWVYFPKELQGAELALEASYLDYLADAPQLKNLRFIAAFLGEVAGIKNPVSNNIQWRHARSAVSYAVYGRLPIMCFYCSEGYLRDKIRISMPIVTPDIVLKQLPELFEQNENLIDLYREDRRLFNEFHQSE